jgi:hypothetical protein
MIIKKNKVIKVSLELFGESLDATIVEKQANGISEHNIPFKFKYNGNWEVKYNCENCNGQCNFGLNFDSSKSPYSNLTYEQSEYLCTKYYDKSLLEVISELFEKTSLITHELNSYVVFDNIFELDFPVTSSIQPIFYSCKKCNSEYIGLIRNGYPYTPDKGYPEGIIGTIFIDEILSVKIERGKKFIELLSEFKKK